MEKNKVSLNLDATHNGHAIKDIFCDKWNVAKDALQMLSAVIQNPLVKGVITIVVQAGELVASRFCK